MYVHVSGQLAVKIGGDLDQGLNRQINILKPPQDFSYMVLQELGIEI